MMPSGSYLLASGFLDDDSPNAPTIEHEMQTAFETCRFRTWPEHRRWYRGLRLVEPSLVYLNDWRPDEDTNQDGPWHTFTCGAIARKP